MKNDGSPNTLFSAGRLEIYLQGEWGTVCGGSTVSFGVEESDVACRELGFYTVNINGRVGHYG